MIVSLGKVLFPYISDFQPYVETWLENKVGQPVRISKLEARWKASGPIFYLSNVELLNSNNGEVDLSIGQAQIDFDFRDLLLRRPHPFHFSVVGASVEILRNQQGEIRILGIASNLLSESAQVKDVSGDWSWLLKQSYLQVDSCTLLIDDEMSGVYLEFEDVDLKIQNIESVMRIKGSMLASSDGQAIDFTVEAQRDSQGNVEGASFYASSQEIQLDPYIASVWEQGERLKMSGLDATLWGKWNAGGTAELRGSIALKNLNWALNPSEEWNLNQLGFEFLLTQKNKNIHLNIEDIQFVHDENQWPNTGLELNLIDIDGKQRIDYFVDYIRLQDIWPLIVSSQSTRVSDVLKTLNAQGDVYDVSGFISGPNLTVERYSLNAKLANLAWSESSSLPGFSGLNGEVSLSNGAADIDFRINQGSFQLSKMFKFPIQLKNSFGNLRWEQTANQWELQSSNLRIETDVIDMDARISLKQLNDQKRPSINLFAQLRNGNIGKIGKYWPRNIIPKATLDWLDTSLIAGRISTATALMYGDLSEWPFDKNQGRFDIMVEVDNATVDYHPDWPRVEELDAKVRFIGTSLQIDANNASIMDIRVPSIEADIPRLAKSELSLSALSRSHSQSFVELLKNSPLNEKFGSVLEGLSVSGDTEVLMDMYLPLYRHAEMEPEIKGSVRLDRANVKNHLWEEHPFEDVEGQLVFTEKGFSSRGLQANYYGQEFDLDIAVGDDTQDPNVLLKLQLNGQMDVESISRYVPMMTDLTSGSSNWLIDVKLHGQTLVDSSMTFDLHSNLRGIEIRLPYPFAKKAEETRNFDIKFPLNWASGELQLNFNNQVFARHRIDSNTQQPQSQIVFGSHYPESFEGDGISITGELGYLNLEEWDAIYEQVSQKGDHQQAVSVNVLADTLVVYGRSFKSVVSKLWSENKYYKMSLLGKEIDATIRFPTQDDQATGIVAEAKYLNWPLVLDEPGQTHRVATKYNPQNRPPLHVLVENLLYDGNPMGQLLLESYPTAEGTRTELSLNNSKDIDVAALGMWTQLGEETQSKFDITITSEALVALLQAFGFSGNINGGQTLVRIEAEWPGNLADMSFDTLDGTLHMEVGAGNFVDINQGAGRIFGLFSLDALPRRLLLDFRDFFEAGLRFDSLEGDFKISNGMAITDNLIVKGATYTMNFSGTTNLIDRVFDQRVHIRSKAGNSLPVVGALAGGAVGAAAFLIIRGVFNKQIASVSEYGYSVTGSWDSPVVVLEDAVASEIITENNSQAEEAETSKTDVTLKEDQEPADQEKPLDTKRMKH